MSGSTQSFRILKCPKCGKSGKAFLSHPTKWDFVTGDEMTSIDQVPEGFGVRSRKDNVIVFECKQCNEAAEFQVR